MQLHLSTKKRKNTKVRIGSFSGRRPRKDDSPQRLLEENHTRRTMPSCNVPKRCLEQRHATHLFQLNRRHAGQLLAWTQHLLHTTTSQSQHQRPRQSNPSPPSLRTSSTWRSLTAPNHRAMLGPDAPCARCIRLNTTRTKFNAAKWHAERVRHGYRPPSTSGRIRSFPASTSFMTLLWSGENHADKRWQSMRWEVRVWRLGGWK